MTKEWIPDNSVKENSNIYTAMSRVYLTDYNKFYNWSITMRQDFWTLTTKLLGIIFDKRYDRFLDLSNGPENPQWLKGSKLNIAKSCFTSPHEAIAIKFQESSDCAIKEITYAQLKEFCNRVANSLKHEGLKPGDVIAIDMPMTAESVAIYLGAILFGAKVMTVADSFASEEIKVRLDITKPKLIFTQDVVSRNGKTLQLYKKVKQVATATCIVIPEAEIHQVTLDENDKPWSIFLSQKKVFAPHSAKPDDIITILFSSGTTGSPKAIPWDHTTPIKSASDGYYHHNIQSGDTVCWPTNLGWMMGPWLVFATLINKGTLGLYYGAPHEKGFGQFIQNAQVTMLGIIPSLVRSWKASKNMETYNWQKIKYFSSTGECSNAEDMSYLMNLAGNKPIIEYCGGTETGGGYITGSVWQNGKPGLFSTPALGSEFVILDESGQKNNKGEVFLVPPIMGLSAKLLNRDHHEVYYKDCPTLENKTLRRHGDQIERLSNNYYKAHGRIDDSMNLGGIKVSSTQIEELINTLPEVQESAAIAVPPAEEGPSQLVIFYVVTEDRPSENPLAKMQRLIRESLNPLFKLSRIYPIQALPRTASNKVMRRKLRELALL
ncbi:MAG: AMP-binding protein [Lentisphaerales bacterium]|nr:AMP-binding protein [Lentisphaerales bacterium]